MIFDPAISIARKSALAYVGAVALTGDKLGETIAQLSERGMVIERSAREQLKQTTRRLGLPANFTPAHPATPLTKTSSVLGQSRDRLLEKLNLPTQTALRELNAQVDHLSMTLDDLRAQMRRAKAEAQAEPLPGYNKMNVDTVVAQLAKFDEAGLHTLRAYEQQHGKRITVLRAIDERLAPPAAAE